VDAIAKHLRTSRRSLQRRLAAADTTLSAEHKRHLLRASEKLLEHTELDLGAIAANVGACSASHLITLFRKHHAMTPGEFRRARRR
jgi:AraC-like DNA-binding protein